MTTFLPVPGRIVNTLIAVLFLSTVFNLRVSSQAHLLTNGSFEVPAMGILNLNNIIGAGSSWGGWNCTNGGFNILRMLGSGYLSGANRASNGDQYVDVAASDGWISQTFTLDHASPLSFSGDFSNREAGWSNYVNWTAQVQIIDSTGAVVATAPTRNFVTTDDMENWYTLTAPMQVTRATLITRL